MKPYNLVQDQEVTCQACQATTGKGWYHMCNEQYCQDIGLGWARLSVLQADEYWFWVVPFRFLVLFSSLRNTILVPTEMVFIVTAYYDIIQTHSLGLSPRK